MKKLPLFRPLSSLSIMVVNVIVIVIVMVAITAIAVKAFTGPGSNQPPSGDVTLSNIPSGLIALFATSCPSGWSEYTATRGRAVIGTPLSGTIAGTTGTALTNLGTRTITDVPSHLHAVDPPSTSSNTTGAHTHSYNVRSLARNIDNVGPYPDVNYGIVSSNTSSDGNHSHTTDIASFNSASTGSASVDVTMPYIQLVYCQKT